MHAPVTNYPSVLNSSVLHDRSRILMPRCVEDNIEEEKIVEDLSVARGCEASVIVEPTTGFQFPTHLAFVDLEDRVEQPHPSCQVRNY